MAWFGRMSGLLGGELTQTGLLKQTKRNTWKEKKKTKKKIFASHTARVWEDKSSF